MPIPVHMSVVDPREHVAVEPAPFPWGLAEQVVALTERSLMAGLEPTLRDLLPQLAEVVGARSITVEIACEGGGSPTVEVDLADEDVAVALAGVLAAAVASAQRVIDARASAAADAAQLRAIARVDELTGALTRRAFLEAVDEAMADAHRDGCIVTIALCDLDGLKAINDAHGHPTGDTALRAFVGVVAANLRGYDTVGRIGGDEFGLILPGTEAEATARILERLTTTIASGPDGVAEVHASWGTARFPYDGTTRDDLLSAADRRLYEHKRLRTS